MGSSLHQAFETGPDAASADRGRGGKRISSPKPHCLPLFRKGDGKHSRAGRERNAETISNETSSTAARKPWSGDALVRTPSRPQRLNRRHNARRKPNTPGVSMISTPSLWPLNRFGNKRPDTSRTPHGNPVRGIMDLASRWRTDNAPGRAALRPWKMPVEGASIRSTRGKARYRSLTDPPDSPKLWDDGFPDHTRKRQLAEVPDSPSFRDDEFPDTTGSRVGAGE